jgi:phosphoheptose isomerase
MGMEVWSLVGSNGDALVELSSVAIKISSQDYQVVENAHMSLIHYLTKVLQRAPVS